MTQCPGCLKQGVSGYCGTCRKSLFGGKKVAQVLNFVRPVYNQARLAASNKRLSISGLQTKMPLRLTGTQLELTETGGRYILKPVPRGEFDNLEFVPANEHVTMQIARQVFRIPVASNALIYFSDGEPAYLARRFDVQDDGSRLLQEDFAQIAERSEESHGKNYKYDLSYEEIAMLLRKHAAKPRTELEEFFRLVVFNYLVHNGDAHLKNFSLIRREPQGTYELTPAYDLLNTRLHLPNEARTALPLFKDDFMTPSFQANGFYAFDGFRRFAERLEIKAARFRQLMRRFSDREEAVHTLIDRAPLPAVLKQAYHAHVRESVQALGYSFDARR